MADWGIKVTKEGEDIASTDPQDYSLWSKFQAMMRVQDSGSDTGQVISSGVGTTTTVTITHDLGYAPLFKVYLEWHFDAPGGPYDSGILDATSGSQEPETANVQFQPKTDTNTLVLRWLNVTGISDLTCDYYYFIGRDPAT